MNADADGWFTLRRTASHGTRYNFVLEDGCEVPDPASRFQPDDVHGQSEVIDDLSYKWQQKGWLGRPWQEMVIYELHIGTFTSEGTFLSATQRLEHLAYLGVTAIQLMPVNDFRGRRGWGYDGVLLYAPEASYGRPEDMKALIDAAHARGICVFVDVVYNHFGPDGNYLPAYTPLFTAKHKSPWGDGVNYDDNGSENIRRLVIENVLYWIEHFRVDGLRFDAVHAIKDDSPEHLLHEIARRAREAAGNRHLHLIVENEDNASSLLERDEHGQPLQFTAQWNDDIHHVLHTAVSGEDFGYYADYAHDASKIGRALAEGFAFQGERMPYRGSARGEPSAHLPPVAFVSFIQNHDQIGNRAYGDRLSGSAKPEALEAIVAIYLLAPQIPMLFMGEEWASKSPFPYFCDFDDDLNQAVRNGRRTELSKLPGFDEESASLVPDPTTEQTFLEAKLDWENIQHAEHSSVLWLYRELIAIRAREIVPHVLQCKTIGYSTENDVVRISWTLGDRLLRLDANLSGELKTNFGRLEGRTIWQRGHVGVDAVGPWAVRWTLCDC